MKREWKIVAILIILGLLPIIDMFLHSGIFFAHDIEQNIARFGAFYETLMEGNIPPQWADGIANGFGGPILIFSYTIPYYIASVFRMLGFSLIDSMKILMAIVFATSGLIMYCWLRKHVNTISALGGSLLYLYAPYRISDIYARGSISEQTAFLFVPFVLLALFLLFRTPSKKTIAILSFAISLLILSHPFFMVIFAPIFFVYTLYLLLNRKKKAKPLLCLVFSFLLAGGITAFFLIPLQLETKYTHYDISPFNGLTFYTQYNTLKQLIMPVWSFLGKYGTREYITYQVGLVHWVIFLGALPILYIMKKRKRGNLGFAFVGIGGFLLSLFFMLPVSQMVYSLIRPLQQIQFPWRFLALSITSIAILFASLCQYAQKSARIVLYIVFVAVAVFYLPHATGHSYTKKLDSYYLEEFETNTEGPGTQPRWAANPEYYKRPDQPIQIIEGTGEILPVRRDTTHHAFTVVSQSPIRIVDNTFYYPGWTAAIDGNPADIQFQDQNYRGLITFFVPEGMHKVDVSFGPTKVRQVAMGISLLTLAGTIFLFIPMKKHRI